MRESMGEDESEGKSSRCGEWTLFSVSASLGRHLRALGRSCLIDSASWGVVVTTTTYNWNMYIYLESPPQHMIHDAQSRRIK
jgi:hypothetical protein